MKESTKHLNNLGMLLIDGNSSSRLRLSLIFKNFFLEVYDASSFTEALSIMKEKDISYIVMDSSVDDINPLDFIEIIKSKNSFLPITVFSDDTSTEELMKYANADVQGYILKPLNYEKLEMIFTKLSLHVKKYFDNSEYIIENYYYNYDKKLLLDQNKRAYKLNNKETKILHLFVKNKNRTIKFEDFEEEIWNKDASSMTSSALRTVIKNLRKKTGLKNIENLSGIGYRFVV